VLPTALWLAKSAKLPTAVLPLTLLFLKRTRSNGGVIAALAQ
jgi:hypothetical protein